MEESQTEQIKKRVKQNLKNQTIQQTIQEKQKKDPQFKQELHRARLLLTQYFNAFDTDDMDTIDMKKQLILSDFPEMYVDIIKFEQWQTKNKDHYPTYQDKYENPVERLIAIKQEWANKK
jgi:hypothetical protein